MLKPGTYNVRMKQLTVHDDGTVALEFVTESDETVHMSLEDRSRLPLMPVGSEASKPMYEAAADWLDAVFSEDPDVFPFATEDLTDAIREYYTKEPPDTDDWEYLLAETIAVALIMGDWAPNCFPHH